MKEIQRQNKIYLVYVYGYVVSVWDSEEKAEKEVETMANEKIEDSPSVFIEAVKLNSIIEG